MRHGLIVAVCVAHVGMMMAFIMWCMFDATSFSSRAGRIRKERRMIASMPRHPVSFAAPPPPKNFRVLCWNVFLRPDILDDAQHTRAQLIGDYIISLAPEVLVLQEVFSKHALEMVSRLRMMGWHWRSKGLRSSTHVEDGGIVILSRIPCLATSGHVFRNASAVSADSLAAKGVVHMSLRCGEDVLHIFGTHFQSGWSGANEATRAAQAGESCDFIRRRVRDTGAVLFCGDFNAAPHEGSIDIVRRTLRLALPQNTSSLPTYDPLTNFMVGCDGDGADVLERSCMFPCMRGCTKAQLDYFLVRQHPRFHFESAQASPLYPLSPEPYQFRLGFTRQLSDHYPVLLDVRQ